MQQTKSLACNIFDVGEVGSWGSKVWKRSNLTKSWCEHTDAHKKGICWDI